jgi:phage I-like protein
MLRVSTDRAASRNNLATLGREIDRLRARAAGSPLLGVMDDRGEIRTLALHAAATADSIRLLLASKAHELGRLRRDTTIFSAAAEVQARLAELSALAAAPVGTLGRARADSALLNSVAQLRSELAALMADVRKHPLRYIHIF